jgi:hypothetical protein
VIFPLARSPVVLPRHADLADRPLTHPLGGVGPIAAVAVKTGTTAESALDMKTPDITVDLLHPDWTYTIRPRSTQPDAQHF